MKTAPTVDAWAVVNCYRLLAWTGRNRTKRNRTKRNKTMLTPTPTKTKRNKTMLTPPTPNNTKQHQTTPN
jgi:hypothetical protein